MELLSRTERLPAARARYLPPACRMQLLLVVLLGLCATSALAAESDPLHPGGLCAVPAVKNLSRVGLLMRLSLGGEPLDDSWKGVGCAAIVAIKHANERNGAIVPELGVCVRDLRVRVHACKLQASPTCYTHVLAPTRVPQPAPTCLHRARCRPSCPSPTTPSRPQSAAYELTATPSSKDLFIDLPQCALPHRAPSPRRTAD